MPHSIQPPPTRQNLRLDLLPVDLLLLILSHILSCASSSDPRELLSIGLVNRTLHTLIEQQAWRIWLEHHAARRSSRRVWARAVASAHRRHEQDARQSSAQEAEEWKQTAMEQFTSDTSWRKQRLTAHQMGIKWKLRNDPDGYFHPSSSSSSTTTTMGSEPNWYWNEPTESFLRLGQEWFLLLAKSEARVWPASYLDQRLSGHLEADCVQGINMDDCQVVQLPANINGTERVRWRKESAASSNPTAVAGDLKQKPLSAAARILALKHPLKHISAATLVSLTGDRIVVGRIDGSLEEFVLPSTISTVRSPTSSSTNDRSSSGNSKRTWKRGAAVSAKTTSPWQRYAPKKLSFEATRVQSLDVMPKGSKTGDAVQGLSFSRGVMACVTRNGTLTLFRRAEAADRPNANGTGQWKQVWQLEMGRQCWTCHLDQRSSSGQGSRSCAPPRWLVVGSRGKIAVYLFRLDEITLQPYRPCFLLASEIPQDVIRPDDERLEMTTSVYTFVQPMQDDEQGIFDENTLVAGFYDGGVRVYDLSCRAVQAEMELLDVGPSSGADEQAGDQPRAAQLVKLLPETIEEAKPHSPESTYYWAVKPRMIFRDRFDRSAIYSLAMGGGGGTHIIAGTATSGAVKIFDAAQTKVQPQQEAEGEQGGGAKGGAKLDKSQQSVVIPGGGGRDDDEPGVYWQGWSVFAGFPNKSPTFDLLQDGPFIIGVTDRMIFDLVFTTTALNRRPKPRLPGPEDWEAGKRDGAKSEGRVAYYHLRDMVLRWSNA